MANELVTLTKRDDGDLEVTLTEEGREYLEETNWLGAGDNLRLYDLLEWDLCNGWRLFDADELGALSSAPVLADGWYEDWRDEGAEYVADGHWWYFEPYQIRSVVTELERHGKAIFTKGA